jgi:hypothetical protein
MVDAANLKSLTFTIFNAPVFGSATPIYDYVVYNDLVNPNNSTLASFIGFNYFSFTEFYLNYLLRVDSRNFENLLHSATALKLSLLTLTSHNYPVNNYIQSAVKASQASTARLTELLRLGRK